MLLVGDIGGTKTDLAIFSTDEKLSSNGLLEPEVQERFESRDYPSLEAIVQEFLSRRKIEISGAVFGVAGPVVDGQIKVTNLPWHISEKHLQASLDLPVVKLLNDLEAVGHAIPYLADQDLEPLHSHQAEVSSSGNRAVIAPGTGLGEAILFYHDDSYHVVASEGGHTDFAPTTLFQIEFLHHLLGKYDHVSYERVCSGALGIPNIYGYLKEVGYAPETPKVAEALQKASDPTPVIVQAALDQECDLCNVTLNIFISILGSEAGNLVLKAMATGGIYLGGGIPPRILPKLKEGTFMAAFLKKGRFSDTLSKVPVYVILNKKPGLLGAVHYGLNHF